MLATSAQEGCDACGAKKVSYGIKVGCGHAVLSHTVSIEEGLTVHDALCHLCCMKVAVPTGQFLMDTSCGQRVDPSSALKLAAYKILFDMSQMRRFHSLLPSETSLTATFQQSRLIPGKVLCARSDCCLLEMD